ncbi:MAG: hypothetical protein ACP5KZ_06720 [bacterium]
MRRWAVYGVIIVLLLAIGVIAITHSLAQPAQQQGQPRMMMPMIGGTAMAANNDYVYLVWMGTLYQYDAKTLKQVNKVELPRPQMPPMGGMGGPQFGPPGQ